MTDTYSRLFAITLLTAVDILFILLIFVSPMVRWKQWRSVDLQYSVRAAKVDIIQSTGAYIQSAFIRLDVPEKMKIEVETDLILLFDK